MYFKKSKFLIVGISKSGYAACNLLISHGSSCFIYDKAPNEVSKKYINELTSRGATLVNGENIEDVISLCDVIILSPGVPIDSEIPIIARKLRKNIIGELELGYYFTKGVIVGITGTNGKTTTCSMIDFILQKSGQKSFLCGNIGNPLCSCCEEIKEDDIAVVEVSSFQLETVAKFTPHIACVINLTPDHLSRHYNMENYVYLKSRILRNLRESEFAVLNADDDKIKEFSQSTRGKAVYFSLSKEVDGAYLQKDEIYWRKEFIMNIKDLTLKGGHNIQNTLVTICVCKLLGIEKEIIESGLREFKGVRHRIQEVGCFNGVTCVNDSKSTNPASTISAINTIEGPFTLLLGGQEKSGYEVLFNELKNKELLKRIVIYGQSREKLYNQAKNVGLKNIEIITDFERAVKVAFLGAVSGDTLLLSPACGSFDEFSGYEERGEKFIEIVNAIGNAV